MGEVRGLPILSASGQNGGMVADDRHGVPNGRRLGASGRTARRVRVDAHLDIHVAAIIDGVGRLLGTLAVPTAARYLKLMAWVQPFGILDKAGVEDAGTYRAGLARLLSDHAIEV